MLLVSACGRDEGDVDEFIGATCGDDRDCDERCYRDGDKYPGGFCSIACNSDRDCPSDTFCVDENGGVCLFGCVEFDCGRLGPGWVCRDRSRAGGGNIDVCFGD